MSGVPLGTALGSPRLPVGAGEALIGRVCSWGRDVPRGSCDCAPGGGKAAEGRRGRKLLKSRAGGARLALGGGVHPLPWNVGSTQAGVPHRYPLGRRASPNRLFGFDLGFDTSFERKDAAFFKCLFLGGDRESQWGRDRGRGRHTPRSRLRALSHQHRARRGAGTHEPRDRDLSRSRTLSRLSHPGAVKERTLLAQKHSLHFQLFGELQGSPFRGAGSANGS